MSLTISAAPATSNALMPTNMDGAVRLAEMMATMKLVPSHLQKSPGDCLMVIEQAMRWGMSPMAVAQSTSVISGKLMFEGKLVAAAIQASGILSSRFKYDFEGDGDTRAVVVRATIAGESEERTIRLTLKEARTSNGMWTKQPDQQLVYAGTRVWGRRHAPEVMLGVYSPEEIEVASSHMDNYSGPTIEAKAEPAPKQKPAADIPSLDADPLRDKVDWIIGKLAKVETEMQFTALEASAPRLLAAIDTSGRADIDMLKGMVIDAIAAKRPLFVKDVAPEYADEAT